MSNEQVKSVAKKANTEVTTVDFEQYADIGFENIGSKDLALPFLKILSQLSPQVTMGDASYIPEAKAGMIFNTVTSELYDGQAGIKVVPCFYKLQYIEWRDRGEANSKAPVNIYESDSNIMEKTTRAEDNKDRLENGNYVEETASHYVVIVDNNLPKETALITMKSTQRKKSKKWNSMMMSVTAKKKDGGIYKPATFTQVYNLKSVLEKNNLGSWYGWDIQHVGAVSNKTLLDAAHDFYKSCSGGKVNVKFEEEEASKKAPF
jgi:hypothetical protein